MFARLHLGEQLLDSAGSLGEVAGVAKRTSRSRGVRRRPRRAPGAEASSSLMQGARPEKSPGRREKYETARRLLFSPFWNNSGFGIRRWARSPQFRIQFPHTTPRSLVATLRRIGFRPGVPGGREIDRCLPCPGLILGRGARYAGNCPWGGRGFRPHVQSKIFANFWRIHEIENSVPRRTGLAPFRLLPRRPSGPFSATSRMRVVL